MPLARWYYIGTFVVLIWCLEIAVAQSRKSGSKPRLNPVEPKRGMLRTVEEAKSVHALNLRLPRELFDRLKALAEEQRRSVNSQITVVLEEWLDGREAGERRSSGNIEAEENGNNEEDEEIGWRSAGG